MFWHYQAAVVETTPANAYTGGRTIWQVSRRRWWHWRKTEQAQLFLSWSFDCKHQRYVISSIFFIDAHDGLIPPDLRRFLWRKTRPLLPTAWSVWRKPDALPVAAISTISTSRKR